LTEKMLRGVICRVGLRVPTQGTAVAGTISCSRSRWSSVSNHIDADNSKATVKPLSAMPCPNGALPLLGHQLLLRKHTKTISNLFDHYFGELGPIFRVKLPAGE